MLSKKIDFGYLLLKSKSTTVYLNSKMPCSIICFRNHIFRKYNVSKSRELTYLDVGISILQFVIFIHILFTGHRFYSFDFDKEPHSSAPEQTEPTESERSRLSSRRFSGIYGPMDFELELEPEPEP